MSEKEPSLTLRLDGDKTLEVTAENTTLYTFLGRTMVDGLAFENENANHAFVRTGRNAGGQAVGMYLFRQFHPAYNDVARFMTENRFPMILNMRQVPSCDMKHYLELVEKTTADFGASLPDTVPEN